MGNTTDELLGLAGRGLARAASTRAGHAARGRRADLDRAPLDGDHRPRPRRVSLTGAQAGIHTDTTHGSARIVEVRSDRVVEALDAGKVVIVAGFQGVSPSHDTTTLGRGGSDTTAVALAAALGADVCEIYTDVDGVFTADPRIVPEAVKRDRLSYEEMLELAASGARVLAARSVEYARNNGVPLHVRSTFSDTAGTWIQRGGGAWSTRSSRASRTTPRRRR